MCYSWVFFLYFYLKIVYILQVFGCLRRIRAVVTLAKKGGWHTFLPPYRLYAQVQVVFISTSAVLSLHRSTSLHISHFQDTLCTRQSQFPSAENLVYSRILFNFPWSQEVRQEISTIWLPLTALYFKDTSKTLSNKFILYCLQDFSLPTGIQPQEEN